LIRERANREAIEVRHRRFDFFVRVVSLPISLVLATLVLIGILPAFAVILATSSGAPAALLLLGLARRASAEAETG
jgi:hypothetical protein